MQSRRPDSLLNIARSAIALKFNLALLPHFVIEAAFVVFVHFVAFCLSFICS